MGRKRQEVSAIKRATARDLGMKAQKDDYRSSLSPTHQTKQFNKDFIRLVLPRVRATTPSMFSLNYKFHELQNRIVRESQVETPSSEYSLVNGRRISYYLVTPTAPSEKKREQVLFLDGDAWVGLNPAFRISDWKKFSDYLNVDLVVPVLPAISERYSIEQRREDLQVFVDQADEKLTSLIGYSSGASDALALMGRSVQKFFLVAPVLDIERLECKKRLNSFFEMPAIISGRSILTPTPSVLPIKGGGDIKPVGPDITIFSFTDDVFFSQQKQLSHELRRQPMRESASVFVFQAPIVIFGRCKPLGRKWRIK